MSEVSDHRDAASTRRLIGLGVVSLLMYGIVAFVSQRFSLDVPTTERPHLLMFGLFGALFVLSLMALRIALRINETRQVLTIAWGFAILFRLVLLGTTPIQEIDLYRYIWDGHVCAAGVSPYRYSPQEVTAAADLNRGLTRDAAMRASSAPLQRLVDLQDENPSLATIVRTIHFAQLPTPYPPVSQAVFAMAAVTTPEGASVHRHLVVMKAWIVLFDLLTMAAMVGLLRACRFPVGGVIAYAWCPLVLKEFANSGHLDSIAVCLMTTGLWWLVRRRSQTGGWSPLLAACAIGLGVGAKLFPIVVVLPAMAWIVSRDGWRRGVSWGVMTITLAVLALSPMWIGSVLDVRPFSEVVPIEGVAFVESGRSLVDESLPPLPTEVDVGESLPPLPTDVDAGESMRADEVAIAEEHPSESGLAAFLTRWRMNDFLFLLAHENLDPMQVAGQEPWFVVTSPEWRSRVTVPIRRWLSVDATTAAFVIARGMTLVILAGLMSWWCWDLLDAHKTARLRDAAGLAESRLLEAAFLTLAWFWLIAPTQNPWYWTWCLPLLPFARSRAWLAVSGLVMIYYLRFWFAAHWPSSLGLTSPGPWGSRYDGASFFDFVVIWLEFAPLFFGLFFGWWFCLGRLFRVDRGEE